jgi:double-stranded uracil-DNA glycosylase
VRAAPGLAASVGFPPVAGADARVLVLGSLPGQMSLARRQYYAQPRNAFWKIAGEVLGFDPALDYESRLQALVERRIALWDTCAAAVRPGSLDAKILRASVVPNDFAPFLAAHPGIRRICFNGAAAATLFERLVLPVLPAPLQALPRVRLPSTSPAHAGMTHARKLELWRAALGAGGDERD